MIFVSLEFIFWNMLKIHTEKGGAVETVQFWRCNLEGAVWNCSSKVQLKKYTFKFQGLRNHKSTDDLAKLSFSIQIIFSSFSLTETDFLPFKICYRTSFFSPPIIQNSIHIYFSSLPSRLPFALTRTYTHAATNPILKKLNFSHHK